MRSNRSRAGNRDKLIFISQSYLYKMESTNLKKVRSSAVYDKEKSIINYNKLGDEDKTKVKFMKRVSTNNTNEIDMILLKDKNSKEFKLDSLPKPPTFSNKKKTYGNSTAKSIVSITNKPIN